MGIYGEARPIGAGLQCLRGLLLLINVAFIIAGIAGIVIGCIWLADKENSYLEFCKPCQNMSIYAIAIFAALLVFSLLGFFALWHRQTCLLYIYAAFLVVFFLAALVITVLVFLIHDGKFDGEFGKAWNAAVKDEPHAICDFQLGVQCRGWTTFCELDGASSNITCANCTYMDPVDTNKLMSFNETCHMVLDDSVTANYKGLLGIGFGLMAMTLLSIVVSCKVRVQYDNYNEISERF